MRAKSSDKLGMFSSPMEFDGLIRALIVIEILSRSANDFQESISKIFGRTWEYKILDLFMKHREMHKAELCIRLFPNRNDVHYKLSRSNQVSHAFNYLLENGILTVVKDLGHKKIYDVSPTYKPILRALLLGDILHYCNLL